MMAFIGVRISWLMELKNAVKDDLTKFLYAKKKRKPMVLPVIMNM